MEKRGKTNIEFILAFILFVVFVAAAIFMLKPGGNVNLIESSEVYIWSELVQNTSVDIDYYSVKIISEAESAECKPVQNGVIVGVANSSGKNARVEDYNGNKIASVEDADATTRKISFSTDKTFVTIKLCEDFDRIAGRVSSNPNEKCYVIASSMTSKAISENRISALKDEYDNRYDSLKKEMGVPADVDFEFSLEFSNGIGSINASRSKPSGINIFSETRRMEVVRKSGNSEFAYMTIKVW